MVTLFKPGWGIWMVGSAGGGVSLSDGVERGRRTRPQTGVVWGGVGT